MNRKYKFKVWLKKEKKMVEPLSINLEKQQILFNEPSDKHWTEIRIVSFDDIELLQYTGIKDKHGTEIYDGDIIIFISEKRNKKYTISFDEEDCSFSIFLDGIGCYQLQKSECHDIKVIGNIYENIELLGE